MKINKGWKEIYKGLSDYNRRRMIEANRPFGKERENNDIIMLSKKIKKILSI